MLSAIATAQPVIVIIQPRLDRLRYSLVCGCSMAPPRWKKCWICRRRVYVLWA